MTLQILLMSPENAEITADANAFAVQLAALLAAAPVSALLLIKEDRDDATYASLARTLLPVAQKHNCALLLQNASELAKSIGADGVHITTGIADVRAAIKTLKPDFIVGTSGNNSHHDAMAAGEAGVDYVLFGALVGRATPKAQEDALWWSETFEIPAVFADPSAQLDDLADTGAEFIGLGDNIFAAENPVQALANAAKKLGIA